MQEETRFDFTTSQLVSQDEVPVSAAFFRGIEMDGGTGRPIIMDVDLVGRRDHFLNGKPGSKVDFEIERVGGRLTLMEIRVLNPFGGVRDRENREEDRFLNA